MYLDYKYNLISDKGKTEAIIKIYCGDYKDVVEINEDNEKTTVSRYIREDQVGLVRVWYDEKMGEEAMCLDLNSELETFRDAEYPDYLIINEQNIYVGD